MEKITQLATDLITISIRNEGEIIRINVDGKIYVKGTLTTDKEVIGEAFMEFAEKYTIDNKNKN
jgi:hypothetical protein